MGWILLVAAIAVAAAVVLLAQPSALRRRLRPDAAAEARELDDLFAAAAGTVRIRPAHWTLRDSVVVAIARSHGRRPAPANGSWWLREDLVFEAAP